MEERETRMEAMRQSLSQEAAFREAVARYLFHRLQLPEDTRERNLYRLVIYSVKRKMPGIDLIRLEERLATEDCHQTTYVVSKKHLLMLEIESALEIHLRDEDVENIQTVDDFADALRATWRTGGEG